MVAMRWLVGFDRTSNSAGAVRFARWLHARTQGEHLLQGVYVLDSAGLGLRDAPGSGPPLEPAQRQAREFLEHHGVLEAFAGVEARHGKPDEVLQELVRERRFDGMVLGRAAPAGAFSLVSLGRVPRRLLRRLDRPTVVVPPDQDDTELGHGPIIVGVAPFPDSIEAVRFAQRLGQQLGLSVMLVHAITRETPVAVLGALSVEPRDPSMSTSDIVPPQDTTPQEQLIEEWVQQHGFGRLLLEVRRGPVPAALRDAGREHAATLIVCGSRRLTLGERLFTSSVGSELAAHADRPVAIVGAPEPTA